MGYWQPVGYGKTEEQYLENGQYLVHHNGGLAYIYKGLIHVQYRFFKNETLVAHYDFVTKELRLKIEE